MRAPRAQASVNVAAIERNCARLRTELSEGAELCAVVKADGYGHGAVQSARAALAGGVAWLAVATAGEACELRDAGVGTTPILVMGALTAGELRDALAADVDVVVWNENYVRAVAEQGGGRVHVKLDSGMGRLGTRDADEATRVLALARELRGVEPVGLMSHFATADDVDDDGFFAHQLDTFARWAQERRDEQPGLLVHTANSAALLRDSGAHFDMARCGIAVYGMDPFGEDAATHGLEPALELSSYVAAAKLARTGESAGYGRRFVAEADTWIATIPIGYADGVTRALTNNCDALIGGRRYPFAGTVSMDNITVDLGPEPAVAVGDEVILIGRSGTERQTAEDVARRLQTISYEVICGISGRVTRAYHRDGTAVTP
jgi:alanine racemase